MNEIKCPHCGQVFKVSESEYNEIVNQVRDEVMEKDLKRREESLRNELEAKYQKEMEEYQKIMNWMDSDDFNDG